MKIKKLNESSLVDKKMSTLGKAGKPIYLTADQLKDAQAKYSDYDFEETEIDKSLPQGQKAYIAKKKISESKQVNESTNEKIELEYDSLPITLYSDKDEDGNYKEKEVKKEYTYSVDKSDIILLLGDELITDEDIPNIDSLSDEEYNKFLSDNFDELFLKYEDKILNYFEDQAKEDYANKYGLDYNGWMNESVKTFGAKAGKLNESADYKVKFFQVFKAPKSPTDNGKMIGQRGTLDLANAFGKEKVGEGNYIIKAVCDDGTTRNIDNDTKPDAYQMMNESIDVATIADYITDHYEFDDIDDKYGCINSIRDSFKDEKTISYEVLNQFIGAHNGRDKVEESVDTVTRYKVEYYTGDNDERLETYIYADSKEEVRKQLVAKTKSEGIDYVMITAMIPETVPASYRENDLNEDKGQPRSKRYTTYFNRIKRAIEKGDEETLQRTKEAIMYAPAKELKNSEAAELMDMIKNRKINEASYGGAFDIEDDQYFIRDDLNSFAEEVLGHVSETFDGKYDIGGVWFENGNVTTQIVDDEGNEFQDTTHVDMRKIREPWHLKRAYALTVASSIIAQIRSFLKDSGALTENVRGMGEYSDKFYDYLDYLEDNGDDGSLSYLVSQLIRYCKEEDLKDLWIDRLSKVAVDNGFGIETDDIDESKKLEESIEEESATAQRYLDIEIPDICSRMIDTIPNMPEHRLVFVNDKLRKFYALMEHYIDMYTSKNESFTENVSSKTGRSLKAGDRVTDPDSGDILEVVDSLGNDGLTCNIKVKNLTTGKVSTENIGTESSWEVVTESLIEDVETPVLSGPVEGPESGLATLLNTAMQDELKTIQMYNDISVTAKSEGFENIVAQIDEINTEENKHLGQLQELLKTIAPNAQAIDAGEVEANDALTIVEESVYNSDDISEDELIIALDSLKEDKNQLNKSQETANNINVLDDDEIDEGVDVMREAWEDIYDSFKQIEKDLNGDGEAITATIDRLCSENEGNLDFKKAYDKWASGE